ETDAMQALAPPVVGWNVQARDRGRGVRKLGSLLLDGHPRHEIGHSPVDRQCGIEIVWPCSALRPGLRGARVLNHDCDRGRQEQGSRDENEISAVVPHFDLLSIASISKSRDSLR